MKNRLNLGFGVLALGWFIAAGITGYAPAPHNWSMFWAMYLMGMVASALAAVL